MSPFRFATAVLAFFLYGSLLWPGEGTLAQTKQPPVLDSSLFAALSDPNQGVRQEAVRRLRDVRPTTREIVSALLSRALEDDAADVRREAIRALGAVGSEGQAAVPALLKLLNTPAEDTPWCEAKSPWSSVPWGQWCLRLSRR